MKRKKSELLFFIFQDQRLPQDYTVIYLYNFILFLIIYKAKRNKNLFDDYKNKNENKFEYSINENNNYDQYKDSIEAVEKNKPEIIYDPATYDGILANANIKQLNSNEKTNQLSKSCQSNIMVKKNYHLNI